MANSRETNDREIIDQITDLPDLFKGDLPGLFKSAMTDAGMADHDTTVQMSRFSRTCSTLHTFFEQALIDRMRVCLWQAVIDDDQAQIIKILDTRPELLLDEPPKNFIIESKLTWQKFYAKNVLAMACKRKQIKMIELLLSYYEKLEQTDEVIQKKIDVLSCWSLYKMRTNADGEDEIVIPKQYMKYAQSLIHVFASERVPNGRDGQLSEKTESALSFLFNIMLLPKSAVKLDNYLDPELFLLALYKAYRDSFDTPVFQNLDQQDAFCVRVIGLAQSVLSPETAKIFCEGLYDVVDENRKISERAESLKLVTGYENIYKSFYRASRDSFSGLGFKYFCGACVGGCVFGALGTWGGNWEAADRLGKAMARKNDEFLKILRNNGIQPKRICRS